ncbi:MAG: hypothetical protein LLF83_01195 [Methanobacterium sp.]|nr:hypothetical protein [Methanobacterium sp.]
MGELNDALNEFQETSKKYYNRIMKILGEKYCWKCPMRTNRKVALCQEVEAWIRLTETLEAGVREELDQHTFTNEQLEAISTKFLEKQLSPTHQKETNIIIKLEEDEPPFACSGDFLEVKTHPLKVKKDSLVVMPLACPLATFWYNKTMKSSTVPYKIFKVYQVFQKNGCRYLKTQEGFQVPVEYLLGTVENILCNDLSMRNLD